MTRLEKAKPMASPIQGIVAREEGGKPISIWEKMVFVFVFFFDFVFGPVRILLGQSRGRSPGQRKPRT